MKLISATMSKGINYLILAHFVAFLILISMAYSNTLIVEAQRHGKSPGGKEGKFSPTTTTQ